MAIWDDHGMTQEEYDAFVREYSDYLDETGQNDLPTEADIVEQESIMGQPSPADIEDMRKERIAYCVRHLDSMPSKIGVELHDFQAMRGYYDSAAFLAEHGDHSRGQLQHVAKFARVVDNMSYDYDPYDYCDNIDLEDYTVNGVVDEVKVHADQAAVIYRDLMNGKADYIASWMDESIADMEAEAKVRDHVETRAEYEQRMQNEAKLFSNMRFEDVLQYRVDNGMILTDVDKKLINDKICDEFTEIEASHAQDMDACDVYVDCADSVVDRYASDYDKQYEVAACGGNLPAYMTNRRYEYPVDEHGHALTADEFVASVEEERAVHTENYMKYRSALFDRICDMHDLTMRPGALPETVTGGKSAVSVITPSTFGYLGDAFKEHHANRVQQELVNLGLVKSASVDWQAAIKAHEESKSRVVFTHSDPVMFDEVADDLPVSKPEQPLGLPIVDFTKSVSMSDVLIDKQIDIQAVTDKQVSHAENYNQYNAQRDQKRDDTVRAGKNRAGISEFNGNRMQGGRSNPDYDFDEYD